MMTRLAQQTCDGANAYAFGIVIEDKPMIFFGEPIRLKAINERASTSAAEIVLLSLTIMAVFVDIFRLAMATVHGRLSFLFLALLV